MSLKSVSEAYTAKSREYIEAVGRIEHVAAPDLELVEAWARSLEGPVLDVGCGPGQWTHHLAGLGVDIQGLDPAKAFIDSARITYPNECFRIGQAEALGVEDSSLGGILAWYSLIHSLPAELDAALAEFARCVWPGGGLALGFFTNSTPGLFEHAVAPAYYWPVELLSAKVEAAGFILTHTETRSDRPARSHGAILATRI